MKRITRAAGLLTTGALTAGLTVSMAAPAHASVTPSPGWFYELTLPRVNTTQCLDVPSRSTSRGVNLQMWHCHGSAPDGANQLFEFVDVDFGGGGPNDRYEIRNKNSHFCLTIESGHNLAKGTPVEQYPCGAAGQAQLWRLAVDTLAPNTRFQLQSADNPDVCMTENGFSAQNGSAVQVGTCVTSDALLGPYESWQLG